MHGAMRIPELSQRDRFVRRAVAQREAWAVVGEDGLAHVDSPNSPGSQVTLLWSNEVEARRWSDVLAENPRVEMIALNDLLGNVLPNLGELKQFVGLDWSADPIECEVEPADLIARMRQETIEAFTQRIRQTNAVWMLEDADGPALLVAQDDDNHLMLPCWALQSEAEARIEGPWADMQAVEIPPHNFVRATLPWLVDQNWLVAPGYLPGGDMMQLSPLDLVRRIEPAVLARSA